MTGKVSKKAGRKQASSQASKHLEGIQLEPRPVWACFKIGGGGGWVKPQMTNVMNEGFPNRPKIMAHCSKNPSPGAFRGL